MFLNVIYYQLWISAPLYVYDAIAMEPLRI